MRIGIVGATGNTGRVVADLVLNDGHDLRAIVRNPDSCADLADRGAQTVSANLDDPDTIDSALEGVEAVYFCSPLPVGFDDPFALELERGRRFIKAARSAAVAHVVLLSAMGPERAPGVALLETKRAIESDLIASGLGYTILRPSMFMDNVALAGPQPLLGMGLTWPYSSEKPIQPIAAADIGAIAFEAVTGPVRNKVYDLVGPEAMTFPQMAEDLGRALGAKIGFTEISDAIYVEHVGAAIGSPEVAQAIADSYRLWERKGGGTGDATVLEKEFELSLTRFADFAANVAKAWRGDNLT